MTNVTSICLDKNFSTTQLLTKEAPDVSGNIKEISSDTNKAFETVLFLPEGEGRQGEGGLRTEGYFKRSYNNRPLITVVTVVFNGEAYLEETIKSVIDQTYDNVEYIIIDGGSTDGTLEIIKKYESQIDYWVSEKDSGIYDAMNKGASLARGDYVAYLNADDWYDLSTIDDVVKAILGHRTVDFIYGNVAIVKDGVRIKTFYPKIKKFKTKMPFGHPSLFLKREVLLKLQFSYEYPVIADYDLIIKLIINKYTSVHVNKQLTHFRLDGVSSTTSLKQEHYRLYKNHFGSLHALVYLIIQSVKDIIKPIIKK
ncbi:glycosyltransferase family 2 protein [Sulfurovum sp.]|uniref:glycosyltransferase family 2 protein n=1 Tax=Sulfurovum sp. TaxID=1969726 RepID=UPI00356ACA09